MGKNTKKPTKTTAKEIHELTNFKRLPEIKLSTNEWISLLSRKVWVKMKYGVLRGVIESIDLTTDKVNIKLENGKYLNVYTYKEMKKNWIKERS